MTLFIGQPHQFARALHIVGQHRASARKGILNGYHRQLAFQNFPHFFLTKTGAHDDNSIVSPINAVLQQLPRRVQAQGIDRRYIIAAALHHFLNAGGDP